jgi:hypothetical protein
MIRDSLLKKQTREVLTITEAMGDIPFRGTYHHGTTVEGGFVA